MKHLGFQPGNRIVQNSERRCERVNDEVWGREELIQEFLWAHEGIADDVVVEASLGDVEAP